MADIREALVARQREEYGESWDVLVPEVGWTLGRIIESVIEDALSDVTPRGVHNHDIDPACPETRLPDGSLRGECTTNASPPTEAQVRDYYALTYTPTEAQVRDYYALTAASPAKAYEEGQRDFDRWLAEVRREVWDEVADYHDRTNAPSIAESVRRDNPYRKERP